MITCETCGNDFPEDRPTCPYCGGNRVFREQNAPRHDAFRSAVLKKGMPTVEEALADLRHQLGTAKVAKTRIIKLVHGYGSTGKGGKIRNAVRSALGKEMNAGKIKDWIPGEDVAVRAEALQKILTELPTLRKDPDYRRPNEGVTFVVLR